MLNTDALKIYPGRALVGIVGPGASFSLPGDKSLSHRAALFAALAQGESRIENLQVSGVSNAMLSALADLGVRWILADKVLIVAGHGFAGWHAPAAALDCGNSATTLRLLAGAVAAAGVQAVLDGSPGLRRRPMDRIIEPLRQMGVSISGGPGDMAPLRIAARRNGQSLQSIDYSLPVASAQVKTCLLLAGLAAEGPVTVCEPGPSRDHTERILAAMGVRVEGWQESGSQAPYITRIWPLGLEGSVESLKPLHMALPGDFSAAAFLIVAGLVTPGSEIVLQGVGLNPTRTGLLDALLAMGANIEILAGADQGGEQVGELIVRYSSLHGIDIAGEMVVRMIDEFPAFAVAAAYAAGETRVRNAAELRLKESDRISALCSELRRLAVDAQELPDGFVIHGGRPPAGGEVDPHGDHRLAMALAVAGLAAAGPVTIDQAGIIAESFPNFQAVLSALGADLGG